MKKYIFLNEKWSFVIELPFYLQNKNSIKNV